MQTKNIANISIGLILIALGIAVGITEPSIVSSVDGVMGGLIGAGIALLVVTYITRKRMIESNEPDERSFRLAEKSAYRTFQIVFPVTGFVFAVITFLDVSFTVQPVLALLFALMGVSYASFYYWYKRRM
jgi:uncharacterized membrane protein